MQYSNECFELPNDKMSLNQPSVTLDYATNLFSGNSVSTSDHVEAETIRNRDEMMFIPPSPFGVPASMQQINRQFHVMPGYSDGDPQLVKQPLHAYSSEQNPQYHGLSLSLGSRVPSLVQGPSNFNQYMNSNLSSSLSLHDVHSQAQVSQISGLKNAEYLSFDLAGGTRDIAVDRLELLPSPKEVHSTSSLREAAGITRTFWNSKYLSAARDLLNEVVSVHRALEKPEKSQDFNSLGRDGSVGTDVKGDLMSSEPYELTVNAASDLSPSERHDLQDKLTKLLSMMDEVDTRYKHYNHQMQILVSSFEMVVGRGAAQPYTTLARRTISRQFRCLRDAIKRHIQVTQKILGEQDVTSHGQGVISRLRFVDQQLRQQKALQQFGITGQPWRPQRGLPENAVSVLRSWLFEHFLHPYPKDSEKIILAKQTGLTRSQVANWFINARVRLWKPMIEEMYKEEFGDAEAEPKASPEHAAVAQKSSYDDREEELQGSLMSSSVNGNPMAQSSEFMTDVISSSEWNVHEAKLSYQAGPYQDNELNFGQTELHHKKLLNMADHRILSDETVPHDKTGCGVVDAADDRHDVSMSSNVIGNQVSLALGLQHCEKSPQPISGGMQPSEDGATASSMGLDKLEYRYTDPVNQQHRFANPHLLSDFVA